MILATKLQPPSLKPNTLPRERLLKLLKNNLERKLVLITGDAGYGKTALLAQAIEEANLPCVFYDLDKGDSDLVVFCAYLVYGLEKLQKGLASRTKGLLEQGGEVGKNYELLFGTLINEIVEKRKEELFFILDDYHALPEDSLAHQGLDYFIDHLPEIVHVILASRTMPPLPSLAKWRAKEDLFELSREGLRFTEEEVKALLSEVYKLVLSEEEIKRVNEQTEGWITGIRLILQSAGKDGKTVKETLNGYLEANQPLFEYFANEVLKEESEDVQWFLRGSSIFEVITPDGCEKILGVENAKKLLADLVKRHLFLSRIGEEQYRYHHLFRDYLKTRLEDSARLHLRAADYYQRKKDQLLAVHHALEAKSYNWAGKLMEQLGEDFERRKQYGTLLTLLGQLPSEELLRNPKLLLFESTVLAWTGNPEKALEAAQGAEAGFRTQGAEAEVRKASLEVAYDKYQLGRTKEAKDEFEALKKEQLDSIVRMNLLNMLGTLYEEEGQFLKAKGEMLEALGLAEAQKNPYFIAMVHNNLGRLAADEGDVRGAYKHNLSSLSAHGREGLRAAVICNNIGYMEVVQRLYPEAEAHLKHGLKVAREYNDGVNEVRLLSTLVWLAGERGDFEKANALLSEAQSTARERSLEAAVRITLIREQARLFVFQGKGREAVEVLKPTLGDKMIKPPEMLFLLGAAHLGAGDLKESAEAFHALLAQSEIRDRKDRYNKARAHLYLAYLHENEGRHKESLHHLQEGLALARKENFDFLLKKLGAGWLPLWKLAVRKKIEAVFLKPLMAEIEKNNISSGPEAPACDLGVCLLGPLTVSYQGKPAKIKWYSRKVKALFEYLVLKRKGTVKAENLTTMFWPRAKEALARHNLRQAVFALRKELARITDRKGETLLIHDEEGFRLSPEINIRLDTEEFASLVREGLRLTQSEPERTLSLLQQAKALWRGEPLSDPEEEWCNGVREDLKNQFLSLHLEMGRIFFSQGNFCEALTSYREVVEADPYAETAHQGIMRCLGKLGKHKELEEHYHALVARLRRDLQCKPMPETRKIGEEAFRGE